MTEQEILRRIVDRLAALEQHGDTSAVLDEAAVEDAFAAWEVARDSGSPRLVAYVRQMVGRLHWARYQAADETRSLVDLFKAAEILSPLVAVQPQILPPGMFEELASDSLPLPDTDALVNCAGALLAVMPAAESLAPFDRAIELYGKAADEAPADRELRFLALINRGTLFGQRFTVSGDILDLDASIEQFDGLARADWPDEEQRLAAFGNLQESWFMRYQVLPDIENLNQAISAGRAGSDLAGSDQPERVFRVAQLGAFLNERFKQAGHRADLDESIILLRRAANATEGLPQQSRYLGALGDATRMRYSIAGNPADLDEAEQVGYAAVQLAPPGEPELLNWVSSLSSTLVARYEQTADPAVISRAIYLLRQIDAAVSRVERFANDSLLGTALLKRTQIDGDTDSLVEAIQRLQNATTMPALLNEPAVTWHNLSIALYLRQQRTPNADGLSQAISAGRNAVAAEKPAEFLTSLGEMLLEQFENTQSKADLDEAVAMLRAATESQAGNPAARAAALRRLGDALVARGSLGHQTAADDFSEAIAGLRAVLDEPLDDDARISVLLKLSIALELRHPLSLDTADLDAAVAALRSAMEIAPDNPQVMATAAGGVSDIIARQAARGERPDNWDDVVDAARLAADAAASERHVMAPGIPDSLYQDTLYEALLGRFDAQGDLADIDEAIATTRESASTASNDLDEAHSRRLLSAALRRRAARTGEMAVMDEAVAEARKALTVTPPDTAERLRANQQLCTALGARFELSGDRASLDEAIELARAGGRELEFDTARLLGIRFGDTGHLSDLNETISLYRRTIEQEEDPHLQLPSLANLCIALAKRYEATGSLDDLDEAIAAGRKALSISRPRAHGRAVELQNLAIALIHRYHLLHEATDRKEAATYLRSALTELHPTDPLYASVQSTLGAVLDHSDHSELIATLRAAVNATPSGHPHLPGRQYNLSQALLEPFRDSETIDAEARIDIMRFSIAPSVPREECLQSTYALHAAGRQLMKDRAGSVQGNSDQIDDLDEAVAVARKAVDIPTTSPHRPMFLLGLGEALRLRFDRTEDQEDLRDAAAALEAGLAVALPDHRFHGKLLRELAKVAVGRAEVDVEHSGVDSAVDLLRLAAEHTGSSANDRFVAAEGLGRLAMTHHRYDDALAGYRAAIRCIPQLAWHGMSRDGRERNLAACAGLSGAAVASALAVGLPDDAVMLSEASRGVLWAQALERSADMIDLAMAAPELAEQLNGVNTELDALEASDVELRPVLETELLNPVMESVVGRYRRS